MLKFSNSKFYQGHQTILYCCQLQIAQFLINHSMIPKSIEDSKIKSREECTFLFVISVVLYMILIVRVYIIFPRHESIHSRQSFLLIVITMGSKRYSDSIVHHVLQEMTSEDKKYAAAYLNETDEIREKAIAEIRRWIEDQLRIQIDDFLILRFLRVCKFNLEKTKIRMQNYYKQRSNLPEWYIIKDLFQPKLQELIDMGLILPLQKPDSQGRLVFIVRCTRFDPTTHELSDFIKIGVMLAELTMKNNTTASVYGCAIYVDVVNPTVRHIALCQPHIFMNVVHAWQSCYPIRVQSINFINTPTFVDHIVRLMKSFMTEKMKNRFHVYSHMSLSCFKDVPADILPIEYGGADGTIQELTDYWKKLVEENHDWIMNDEHDKIEYSTYL
ncbi:PREDICTED: alpha-tocopherol transfer protein-like [Wasmannia auropunctata]|uniref:alpha-tocopherol transfer protein-like n=1 Tax=Wasmannia auropunctata TaxID=64793 RepID=UPI0005EE746F|nr:PREDICTED: alpha-tocopherol transfer protein-like [Wasmannia auropunctata]